MILSLTEQGIGGVTSSCLYTVSVSKEEVGKNYGLLHKRSEKSNYSQNAEMVAQKSRGDLNSSPSKPMCKIKSQLFLQIARQRKKVKKSVKKMRSKNFFYS